MKKIFLSHFNRISYAGVVVLRQGRSLVRANKNFLQYAVPLCIIHRQLAKESRRPENTPRKVRAQPRPV